MYTTISTLEAESLLQAQGFSFFAAKALVSYLEEYEEGICEDYQFDAVAIRCEFHEYTAEELADNYSELSLRMGFNTIDELLDYLEENTVLIPTDDDTFVIQDI